MLKKMQRRFILAAMAAFGTVMLILLAGINIANYQRTTAAQDEMVRNLLRREQRLAGRPEEEGRSGAAGRSVAEGQSGAAGRSVAEEQPETEVQSEAPGHPGAEGQPVAEGHSEAARQPVAEGRPETESQSEATGQPGAEGQPVAEGHSEVARQPVAEGQPETESQSEATGQPGAVGQPEAAGHPEEDPAPLGELPFGGPEAEFTTRFFAVHYDLSGRVRFISRDHISSIDEETARAYGADVLEKGREKGYYGEYRYGVKQDGDSITVLFLNTAGPLQFVHTLFWLSLAIGAASLAVVFLLVVFFSRYAIRPYVKNMERQKRFITDAGHELKTPITSIAASADIAAMEYEGDEWISNIQKQTARLAKLVGELVALSRMDEEAPLPEKSTFSLSDAAWEAAEPFAVLAKASGKAYTQNIGENITLYGNSGSVRQMISILLDNAVRYSGEGGEIRLDIFRRRGKIYIWVFNTCSLPDISDLDRLFDRFYRLDESRSIHTGGTGIGLSMARAIAEAHGGRIGVRSEEGKRIWFTVCIS